MTRLRSYFGVGFLVLFLFVGSVGKSEALSDGGLVFRELNITGSELLVIQNASGQPLTLNNYWLGYNSDASVIAGPSEQLPKVTLDTDKRLLLSNQTMPTCGAVAAGKLPFSLSNTAGTLALWHYDSSSNPVSFSFVESVSWDKSASTNSNHLDIEDEKNVEDLYENTNVAPAPTWLKPLPSSVDTDPDWHAGNLDECTFTPVSRASDTGGPSAGDDYVWPASTDYPSFTMLPPKYVGKSSKAAPMIPAADIGLKPPMVNELLPNPATPGTDAKDEFVELYNPNPLSFDLSGFEIEAGSTSSSRRHHYKIPAGTIIRPQSFKVFTSGGSDISLTNGGGQVWLLDPFAKVIAKSGVYGEAKDGQAFAMADGKWYWTLLPTPGAPNSIQQPVSVSGSSQSTPSDPTVDGKMAGAVRGAGTSGATLASSSPSADEEPAPVHPVVLATIAIIALAYGLYEYRSDLSNKLYQLRKYRTARRANRR